MIFLERGDAAVRRMPSCSALVTPLAMTARWSTAGLAVGRASTPSVARCPTGDELEMVAHCSGPLPACGGRVTRPQRVSACAIRDAGGLSCLAVRLQAVRCRPEPPQPVRA